MMYDIAIIGLGPAGATLARLLDKKYRIIAIDKKGDNSRQKPCGGLLAPDAQKILAKLNLTLPKTILADPQIFAVKTIDAGQNLTRYYQRFYLNIDRHKFDMWLISLIPHSVETVMDAVCDDIEDGGNYYDITFTRGEEKRQIRAQYVIGADGANSIVRRRLFPGKKIRQYLSIQQFFTEKHANPFYSCIFDREITASYCWGLSKDGCFILGGSFHPKTAKRDFARLKEKLRGQGFFFGEPVKTEACLLSPPRRGSDFCLGNNRTFLVGEAAGFISPSSLEGISHALNSAYQLARVLNSRSANPARQYGRKTFSIRLKLLLKIIKMPFMYNPSLRRLVMKSGLKSIDVI